jgi:hypothetical protein
MKAFMFVIALLLLGWISSCTPSFTKFSTEEGKICGKKCRSAYSGCNGACFYKDPSIQGKCYHRCDQILNDCYSTCE